MIVFFLYVFYCSDGYLYMKYIKMIQSIQMQLEVLIVNLHYYYYVSVCNSPQIYSGDA